MFLYRAYLCRYDNGHLSVSLSPHDELANPKNFKWGAKPTVLTTAVGNSVREVLATLAIISYERLKEIDPFAKIRLPVLARFLKTDLPEGRRERFFSDVVSAKDDAPDAFLEEWEPNHQAEISCLINKEEIKFYVPLMPARFREGNLKSQTAGS